MPWLLTTLALAADPGDLEAWTKPDGDLPVVETEARISCCGFDRSAWRELLDPRKEAVGDCVPEVRDREVRLALTLTVEARTGAVALQSDTGWPEVDGCLADVFSDAVWPREPLDCPLRITWPVLVVPPRDAAEDD